MLRFSSGVCNTATKTHSLKPKTQHSFYPFWRSSLFSLLGGRRAATVFLCQQKLHSRDHRNPHAARVEMREIIMC